jgi:hypothetical protein
VRRGGALVTSVVLVAAVLSPLARDPRRDGFPLSTYPMFAAPRDTRMTLSFAYGVTAAGDRRLLEPAVVGTREVLQAAMTIAQAVGRGAADAAELCRHIATAVADDPQRADVVEVRVVTGDEDAVAYLADGSFGPERLRARCAVERDDRR